MNQYDMFADIYDIDLGKNARDLRMYSQMIKKAKKILVLSCGTGRETEYFCDFYDEVWGLDISEKMLLEAKKRTSTKNNVKYIQGDMRNFNINEKFDAIIIPNNGILHLLRIGYIEECLINCKDHLNEDGVIALDFFIPDYNSLSSSKSEKIHDYTKYDNALNKFITRERVHTRDIFRKLNHTQIFYEFCDLEGNCVKRICEYTIRYLFVDEFELLTRLVGLTISNRYGGFEFEKFGSDHRNVVYQLRKV